jgi:hypothetical protein
MTGMPVELGRIRKGIAFARPLLRRFHQNLSASTKEASAGPGGRVAPALGEGGPSRPMARRKPPERAGAGRGPLGPPAGRLNRPRVAEAMASAMALLVVRDAQAGGGA